MPQALLCPSCGSALTGGEPKGLCPRCLIKRGMEAHTAGYTESGAVAKGWEPPTPAELAGQFEAVEVLELLGRGGMGAVYRARQKQLDRIVALKILPPGIGQDPAFAERFTREAKALARLNHPNIVTLYEFGRTGAGLYYFLMEYVDGVSLRRLMDDGRVAPREALAIVPQVCDALQYAHDQGIVHRDIKPENVLLDRRGRVKVADFGLAKIVGQDENSTGAGAGGPSGAANTEAGRVVGTPQYMAPEQAGNPGEVDHRSDIYALGVVFYQMLTGELPGRPVEAPSRRIHFDVRLDEVVLRALEREPRLRYAQASEMKTHVELIANASPADGSSKMPADRAGAHIPARRRHAMHVALVIALACILVAGITILILDRSSRREAAAAFAAANEFKLKQDADAAEQVKLKKDAEAAEQLKIKHDADVERIDRTEKNNNLEQLKLNYQGQIHEITDRMTGIATKLAAAGVGVNDRGNSKEIELQALIVEQLRVIATLGATDAKFKTFEKQMETDSAPELDEACQRSPLYADYRHQYDDLNLSYNELVAPVGAENTQSVALKHRLDSAQKKLSETENAIKSKTAELIRSNLTNDRNTAQQALVRIEKRLADIRSEIAEFTKERSEYDHLATRLAHLRDRLDRVTDEQDRIVYGLPSEKAR